MADSKTKKRCSFCGRSENEVGFLITGMNGYICDSCATQAYEITQEALGEGKKSAGATKLNLKELPKPVEIKKFHQPYQEEQGRCRDSHRSQLSSYGNQTRAREHEYLRPRRRSSFMICLYCLLFVLFVSSIIEYHLFLSRYLYLSEKEFEPN